jgi:hypothetical protein
MRLVIPLLLFALGPAPASAGVDVDPVPWSPKVSVKVKDSREPRSATARTSEPDPTPDVPYRCYYDGQEPDYRCAYQTFADEEPSNQDLEPGDVLTAAREEGMPALKLRIQPGGSTLVNVDTIFYTNPTHLRRTVALLGHEVQLDARPVRFTWVHGDGTQASTARPGRPYPAKDITHQYQQPGDDLRARVDTTYRVRFSVDGGAWDELGETLTAPGPATTLDVDEAAPVLTR